MNSKINEDWLSAGYQFLRAVLVEAVEALDHYGWKWWSANQPDYEQLRIELIDIWHFLLAEYLARNSGDIERAALAIARDWALDPNVVFDGQCYNTDHLEIRESLELLAGLAAVRRISMPLVARLMSSCGISSLQLFREYVSKNVLNHFRQDHGYKSGTYKKIWDGREDNVHLARIVETIACADEELPTAIYEQLMQQYVGYQAEGKLK